MVKRKENLWPFFKKFVMKPLFFKWFTVINDVQIPFPEYSIYLRQKKLEK